jgi:hypothetical protein
MLQPKSFEKTSAWIAFHGDLGIGAGNSADRPQTMQATRPELAF